MKEFFKIGGILIKLGFNLILIALLLPILFVIFKLGMSILF